jgi:hypothetical protein
MVLFVTQLRKTPEVVSDSKVIKAKGFRFAASFTRRVLL